MPITKIPFTCRSCRAVNWADADLDKIGNSRIILICGACGRANEAKETRTSKDPEHVGMSYLYCIPFDGAEKSLPTGPITVAGETQWKDANGKPWSRDDFILKYGIDPAVAWINIQAEYKAIQDAIKGSINIKGGVVKTNYLKYQF